MKFNKPNREIFNLIFATTFGIIIIVLVFFNYFGGVKNYLTELEQKQLLTISQSVSKSIERFFEYQTRNIEILISSTSFKNEFDKNQIDNTNIAFDKLNDYVEFQSDVLDGYEIYDADLNILYSYPTSRDLKEYKINRKFLDNFNGKSNYVSDIYKYKDKFYVNLYVPYLNTQDEIGDIDSIICLIIDLNEIYVKFVQPIRAGEKGYASVKDYRGTLIMHPKDEDLGVDVMEARKKEFPDYDWAELEQMVEKQKNMESGVGTYHSIWYHDEKKDRVKKINAYSPAIVGDEFWVITVSMDYLEMTSFIRNTTITSFSIIIIILIIFIGMMLYVYKIKKDKSILETEAEYAKQVNQLNVTLEEDIKERIQLQSMLERNIKKYERLFNGASDCIFVMDIKDNDKPSKLVEVNEKALIAMGYSKEELIGKKYIDISKNYSKDEINQIIKKLRTDNHHIFEDILLKNGGGEIPVEINAQIFEIFDQDKVIFISRDISERKIQEEALKRSQNRFRNIVNQLANEMKVSLLSDSVNDFDNKKMALELEQINIELEKMFQHEVDENKRKEALMIYQSRLAAMGEMIGNIAHQWRQPLSTLSMILTNIYDNYIYDDLSEAFLKEKIDKSKILINHMSNTIDDFRYFFNPKDEVRIFSIEEIIKYSLNFLNDHLRINNINIDMHILNDFEISGFSNQFAQVIFTIIQNSVDAIVENSIYKGHIDITIFEKNNFGNILIEDNGGGINNEILDKIFEPYFTTKASTKGTGLGLYMSKTVIEKSFNGTITIENKNNGLIIMINLPIRRNIDES